MADKSNRDSAEGSGGRRVDGRLVVGGILGVALLALVLQNTNDATVTWLFFDITAPLWIVLLGTAAVALVVGELVGAALRRRKAKQVKRSKKA